MEHAQHDDDNPRRRLSEQFRQAHIEKALHEAVAAGRLGPAEAAGIFNRLARGGDPHALRRELRAAGVLIRRSANNKQDEGEGSA